MSNITNFFKGFIPDSVSTPTPQPKLNTTSGRNTKTTFENEDKIKISGNFSFFFDFRVIGKSIFQNLVITAAGYIFNEFKEKEVIPLKYIWKRVNGQSIRYMEEINSNSYIPTAEDIGHIIQLEAYSLEQNTEVAYASFGPINLDDDMKNTLELLLSAGGTKFSCFSYNVKENQKDKDKEIILYVNASEIKLTETFFDGSEKVLEQIKYHSTNPRIKLHPFDTKRLTVSVFEYDLSSQGKNCASSDLISERLKSEYNLVAMSKQCRELIYLLIQCFVIDEKLKNNKLFSSVNYNVLQFDSKIGILDLITELKALREENYILLNNNLFLEKDNLNLKKEMADLEMDTQITLQAIKNSHYCNTDSTTPGNSYISNSLNNQQVHYVNNSIIPNDNYNTLKKKYDQLSLDFTTLLSKEKAIKENVSKLTLDNEIERNRAEALKGDLLLQKEKNTSMLNEISSLEKSTKYLNDSLSNLQKEMSTLKIENQEMKKILKENEDLKESSKNGAILSKEYLELKQTLEKIERTNKTLTHEKDQLLNIKNVLQSQKDTLSKEYEKAIREKNELEKNSSVFVTENDKLKGKITELEEKLKNISSNESNLKKEISNLRNKYDVLEIQFNTLKMTSYSQGNDKGQFISEEEYNELDNLRREKDEVEALILKLQSNDLAKQKEIDELKKKLESLKN